MFVSVRRIHHTAGSQLKGVIHEVCLVCAASGASASLPASDAPTGGGAAAMGGSCLVTSVVCCLFIHGACVCLVSLVQL